MTPAPAHPRLVPVLISVGLGVAMVSSVGAPMVPTVADDYDISLAAAQWTLTISLLTGAVTAPMLSRLGDGSLRRRVLVGTLSVIFVGSVVCAIPSTFWLLMIGRAMQGLGLGLMPLAMTIARDHLPAATSGRAISALSITTATGVGLGYPLSGLLADTVGFHATHLVVAITIAAVTVAAVRVVPSSDHLPRRGFDPIAAVLLATGVAAIVIASAESSAWGIGSIRILTLVAVAVAMFALWAWRELRTPKPLIQLRTLRFPSVRAAQSGAVLAGVGMFFTMAIIIRYVQTPVSIDYGLGGSVLVAGLLLVPFSIASLAVHRLLPVLFRRMSDAWLMSLGSAISAVSMVLFTLWRASLWELAIVTAIAGAGIGMVFAALPMLVVGVVAPHETGSTLGFNQVSRTVGGAIGSAASGAVLAAYTTARFPSARGYTVAGLVAIGVWLLALLVSIPGRDRRRLDRS